MGCRRSGTVKRRSGHSWIAVTVLAAVTAAVTSVVLPSGPAAAHVPHDRITDVVVSPMFETDRTVFVISRNRLMRSTDGGSSWSQMVRGTTGLSSRLAVAPSNPRLLYMSVLHEGVFRSRDQGWSWQRIGGLAAMSHIGDVAVSPTSSDVAFATGASAGLFRTTDGGASWRSVGSFGRVTALSVSASRVIVGVDGKVFTSDDQGGTWTQSSGVRGGAITALASSGATVLADPTPTPWGSRNSRLEAPAGLQLTLFEEPADGSSERVTA